MHCIFVCLYILLCLTVVHEKLNSSKLLDVCKRCVKFKLRKNWTQSNRPRSSHCAKTGVLVTARQRGHLIRFIRSQRPNPPPQLPSSTIQPPHNNTNRIQNISIYGLHRLCERRSERLNRKTLIKCAKCKHRRVTDDFLY